MWKVETQIRRLKTGDYHFFVNGEHVATGEKKASIPELAVNLFGPAYRRRNFLNGLDRLAGLPNPFLYLDITWQKLSHPAQYQGVPDVLPTTVLDELFVELEIRRIRFLGPMSSSSVSTKIQAGDFMLRCLLAWSQPKKKWTTYTNGIEDRREKLTSSASIVLTRPPSDVYTVPDEIEVIPPTEKRRPHADDCKPEAYSSAFLTDSTLLGSGVNTGTANVASIVHRKHRIVPKEGRI